MWHKNKPFIIAEMSGNHNQSLDRAFEIVDAAAASGVDAIKLQTYTADTITMKGAHTILEEGSLWYGKELHDLYKEAYTPWDWHKPIFERAKQKGVMCFSSPFDETAVDLLESLNCPIYKIASFENTHHPLLVKVAKTKKPVIMSTGVANLSDILESVALLKKNGATDITLLKCTSTYPATAENSNLLTIPLLKQVFPECKIGLSDHTMGIGVGVASVALGGIVIEKHFTLRRADGGVDSAFSMEPHEMKQLVYESNQAFMALGAPQLSIQKAEEKNVLYKRSIYAAEDIKEGELFSEKNIKVIRPGNGLSPKFYFELLGKKANKGLKKGSPLTWDSII
jgi:pseudaminic acid synthase